MRTDTRTLKQEIADRNTNPDTLHGRLWEPQRHDPCRGASTTNTSGAPTAAWCRKELAHIDLHTPGSDRAPDDGTLTGEPPTASPHRGIREVEADSVAYMVNAAHGLVTDSSTIPYVAEWASTVPGASIAETIQSTAARVREAAIKILDGLDTHQIPDGAPPGLDRAPGRKPTSPAPEPPRRPDRTVPDRARPVAMTDGIGQ